MPPSSLHYFEHDVLLWLGAWPRRWLQWLAVWIGRAILQASRARARVAAHAPWSSAPARWASRWRARCESDATRASTSSATSTTAPTSRVAPRGRRRSCWAALQGRRRLHARHTASRGLHHPAAGLAAAHRRAARAGAGHHRSLFFVPDVFGISIIQGRLQDMNGVPVVGICETPFTGTNELVKRVSDIVLAIAHPGADLAAAAGDRHRRQAQLAGAGDLPAAAQRPGRRARSWSTSSAR